MDNATINEIREIIKRQLEIEDERKKLNARLITLAGLGDGPRKSPRAGLSPEDGKALFRKLKGART